MAQMRTDAATLSAEAANFDRIGSEIQQVTKTVESVGGDLAAQWQGRAGSAVQGALTRYREAASAQIAQLTEITNSLQQAGIKYSAADDEQAGTLQAGMQI